MYGSDAGQPMPSLYTKGLPPLCDNTHEKTALKYVSISGCCKTSNCFRQAKPRSSLRTATLGLLPQADAQAVVDIYPASEQQKNVIQGTGW